MNLENIKKIYFIGIGGIGMSAVAGIARERGYHVSGSDATDVYQPSKGVLDKYGIPYFIGYNADNLKDAELVVTTSAVDQSNPEVVVAVEKNIRIVSFAELLAELVKDKKQVMVVGTHGKGTTSGLLGYVLKNINDSSFFIGGVLNQLSTNFYLGSGPCFVIEGDEYKANFNDNQAKFSFFSPDVLLINNLEWDHPDLYPDLLSYKQAFEKLTLSLPETATVIYNIDDLNVRDVVSNTLAKKIGYSMEVKNDAAKYSLSQSPEVNNGIFEYVVRSQEMTFAIKTQLPGLIYGYNNLAAVSVLLELGLKPEDFLGAVFEYSGIKRRYEIISEGDFTIIDDYAHHPSAVKQSLEATKLKYPQHRIIAFFEPHTYSRTKETLPDLVKAFSSADLVYLAEVYPAREQKLQSSITGQEVLNELEKNHPNAHYVKDRTDALVKYSEEAKKGDVIVVMAVGSFNTLAYDLKEKYGK